MQKVTYPPHLTEMLDRALKDMEGFWGEAARELYWFKPWNQVFECKYPDFGWFVGGLTNISYNAVHYHVLQKGRANKAAIIWESGETGEGRVVTYSRLLGDLDEASCKASVGGP